MGIFARNDAQEKREFLAGAVFPAGGFAGAFFIGAPLFDEVDAEARLEKSLAIGRE